MIHKNIHIEDLIRDIPKSVRYLMEHSIKCLACGEPVWGTLEITAKEKGFSDTYVQRFVEDLNSLGRSTHKSNF